VVELTKLSAILLVGVFVLIVSSLVGPGFADVPQVRSVIVWKDGVNTVLNVTVYHNQEIASHRVDSLTVTIDGSPQVFPQSEPHALDPLTSTFNVTLNVGSVTDSPSATVVAHCNLHGSSSENWTGTLPEFPLAALTLLLFAAASLVVALLRKSRLASGR
jgi:hypothetical protein